MIGSEDARKLQEEYDSFLQRKRTLKQEHRERTVSSEPESAEPVEPPRKAIPADPGNSGVLYRKP